MSAIAVPGLQASPPSVGNRAPGAWTSGASRRRFSAGEQVRKAPVKRDARGGKLMGLAW